MILNWEKDADLIKGQDPRTLIVQLDELVKSPAWNFLMSHLNEEVTTRKERLFREIDNDDHKQRHNQNVITIKVLECVPQLAEEAMKKCKEKIDKGDY